MIDNQDTEYLTQEVLNARGFRYATDPMEFGQDVYDITNEAREDILFAKQYGEISILENVRNNLPHYTWLINE